MRSELFPYKFVADCGDNITNERSRAEYRSFWQTIGNMESIGFRANIILFPLIAVHSSGSHTAIE
jgi:hypothetical protein